MELSVARDPRSGDVLSSSLLYPLRGSCSFQSTCSASSHLCSLLIPNPRRCHPPSICISATGRQTPTAQTASPPHFFMQAVTPILRYDTHPSLFLDIGANLTHHFDEGLLCPRKFIGHFLTQCWKFHCCGKCDFKSNIKFLPPFSSQPNLTCVS